MRDRYNRQLQQLNTQLTEMGAMCETAISAALKGLLDNDPQQVKIAFETDREIDKQEREIESLCLKLLLEQQPVASDLRMISSAMKIISDMERIGDQASDIAQLSKHFRSTSLPAQTEMQTMAKSVIKMVTASVDSFIKKDMDIARKVVEYDDKIDSLFDQIKNQLINNIANGRWDGNDCLDTLMIAKYLERIGDHAENIAQWVEYAVTGEYEF